MSTLLPQFRKEEKKQKVEKIDSNVATRQKNEARISTMDRDKPILNKGLQSLIGLSLSVKHGNCNSWEHFISKDFREGAALLHRKTFILN